MKKELFAALLLAALLILSLINTHVIDGLCSGISENVRAAGEQAALGDFEGAGRSVSRALRLWHGAESYTMCVLRHTDLESIDSALYALLEAVSLESPSAVVAAEAALEHLAELSKMEGINPGSIF